MDWLFSIVPPVISATLPAVKFKPPPKPVEPFVLTAVFPDIFPSDILKQELYTLIPPPVVAAALFSNVPPLT